MNTIKSFSDFNKPEAKVEEQFGNIAKRRAEKKVMKGSEKLKKVKGVKGTETWKDQSGKKHKVIWKAQDAKNFIVKLVNDYNWLDSNGNLTQNGQIALLQFLNGENSFINQYGKLDEMFFSKNIIVYSVKRDSDKRQKIQFSINDRALLNSKIEAAAVDGKEMLNIDGVKFINASELVNLDNAVATNVTNLLNTTILQVPDENTGQEETEETEEIEDEIDEIPIQDDSLIGKKFEYQSGADGKIYTITVAQEEGTNNLKFWAKSKDSTNEGWVILKNEEPFWLNQDGSSSAITNAKDRAFFIRIYTDSEYLRQLVEEYDAKYPEGEDLSIKDMLYYTNGNRIYPSDSSTGSTGSGISGAEILANM